MLGAAGRLPSETDGVRAGSDVEDDEKETAAFSRVGRAIAKEREPQEAKKQKAGET